MGSHKYPLPYGFSKAQGLEAIFGGLFTIVGFCFLLYPVD